MRDKEERTVKTFEQSKRAVGGGAIIAAALALMAGPAAAHDVCLKATTFTGTYPDGGAGTTVPMWGYASAPYTGGACDWASVGTPSAPGPVIEVPVGDTSLTIHLRNELPTGTPTSLVIPGQVAPLSPVWVEPGAPATTYTSRSSNTMRIRSVTAETMPVADGGGDGTYSWSNLAPGTYLYRSGTMPQVQVQMGLYGAMTADSGVGEAYPGIAYVDQALLVYSAIDPALHAAVDVGDYGPAMSMTSTIDYNPKFFLINGAPFDPLVAGSNEFAVTQNTSALIRFVNAGLESHAPTTYGLRMNLVAEDGNPYPFTRNQYSALLPAGKTLDAIVQSPDPVRYALVDHMLSLTNDGSSPGGMMAFLNAAAATPLVAMDDPYAAVEDVTLNVDALSGVLSNDTPGTGETAVMATNVPAGTGAVTLNADGSFDYVPAANFNGSTQFTYQTTNGTQWSNIATVSITVAPQPDAPVAVADSYDVVEGQILNVGAPGVLGNDSDVDGDPLTAVQDSGTIVLSSDGSFSFDATALLAGATDSFTYHANDGSLDSATVTVTINVTAPPANVAPVAVDDFVQVVKGSTAYITVLVNDGDPDGTLDPATIEIVTGPNHGKGVATAITNSTDPNYGTIEYVADPFYGGTELFTYRVMDNDGAWSNTAKVKVNLVN